MADVTRHGMAFIRASAASAILRRRSSADSGPAAAVAGDAGLSPPNFLPEPNAGAARSAALQGETDLVRGGGKKQSQSLILLAYHRLQLWLIGSNHLVNLLG